MAYTLDDVALAHLEVEGLPAVTGGVELGTVQQHACVVGSDQVARLVGHLSRALPQDLRHDEVGVGGGGGGTGHNAACETPSRF